MLAVAGSSWSSATSWAFRMASATFLLSFISSRSITPGGTNSASLSSMGWSLVTLLLLTGSLGVGGHEADGSYGLRGPSTQQRRGGTFRSAFSKDSAAKARRLIRIRHIMEYLVATIHFPYPAPNPRSVRH